MQIVSNVALISINETLLVQLISFLIFVFILNRLMVRPLRGAMSERDAYMDGMEKEIVDASRTMVDVQEKIRKQEAETRRSAQRERDRIEAAGTRQADEILQSVREEISALRKKAHEDVTLKIHEARDQVQKEAASLAEAMMVKALNRRVSQ